MLSMCLWAGTTQLSLYSCVDQSLISIVRGQFTLLLFFGRECCSHCVCCYKPVQLVMTCSKSDRRESSHALLDLGHGDLRRDEDASNSIILTWQTSFERIWQTRRSATDLLLLMSLCNYSSIPESLISPGQDNNSKEDTEFVKDLSVLVGILFIAELSHGLAFKMYR